MGVLSYRLAHNLRSRWRTTLALVAVVAVAGGLVLALCAGAARTLSTPDRYSSWRGARYDASLEQEHGAPRTAELRALPAVAAIEQASFVFGGLQRDGRDDRIDALVFSGSAAAFSTRLVQGRDADPAVPGEFEATRSFVDAIGAKVGDHFTLRTITQAQADATGFDAADPSGPTLDATLVGVLDGPEELQDGYALALFSPALLQAGDVGIAATVGSVALAPGATLADLRSQLDTLPDGGSFGLSAAEWVPAPVRAAVSAEGQGLAILAGIVALATIVVVGQLLTRQVRLAAHQRRALQAMGMTRSQIVADPVLSAAVPTVLGSVLAVLIAFVASSIFPIGFVQHVEPHPGRRFDLLVHAGGAVVFALVLLAWVAVAIRTSESTRRTRAVTGIVDRVAPRLRPAEASTGLRFAFTRPGGGANGLRAAVAGMVVVFGLLVGAMTFGASLEGFVDDPARWGANFDASVGAGGGALRDDIRSQLESDPNVSGLSLFGTILTSVGTDAFNITGIEPVLGSVTPILLAGRAPQGDDEIAVGRVVAAHLGIGVGDQLDVTGPAGPRTLRVTGLAVLPNIDGADGVGQGGYMTFAAVQRIDPSAGLTTAVIRFHRDAPDDAASELAARTGMAVGPMDRPGVIVNLARVRDIPYVVAAVLAALALLSLAHQLILSAERRRRDIAVLRALGADRRWVTSLVHWQATLFTAVVLCLALPIGVFAGLVVFRTFVGRVGALDTITVPLLTLGLSLTVLLVLVNLVAAGNAIRARRRVPAWTLTAE